MQTAEHETVISRKTPYEELPSRLTVEEYQAATGTGRGTVYEAVRAGALPAIRIGRRLLIPREALRATSEVA
jgi:excisionase family DNA binding protein